METTKEKHATHTPGPWEIQDAGPGTIRGLRFRVITNEKVIAKTSDGLEEARANARLIAAAPAMLEMLRDLSKVIENLESIGANLPYYFKDDMSMSDKLREVLAKVEGGEG